MKISLCHQSEPSQKGDGFLLSLQHLCGLLQDAGGVFFGRRRREGAGFKGGLVGFGEGEQGVFSVGLPFQQLRKLFRLGEVQLLHALRDGTAAIEIVAIPF